MVTSPNLREFPSSLLDATEARLIERLSRPKSLKDSARIPVAL